MSSTSRAGSYRDVLLLPNALRTFAPALLGRLSYGLLPLSTLFAVQHSTDSFATAGAAVAAFGLASLSMPFKAWSIVTANAACCRSSPRSAQPAWPL